MRTISTAEVAAAMVDDQPYRAARTLPLNYTLERIRRAG